MARRKRVIVGMSGGVDSSVAAALLLDSGYDVIGVTLNVWPNGDDRRENSCCAVSAVEDARRVADRLSIDHYTLNFREVFERTVIADFAAEYRCGRTPNPCIRCNEHIKFAAVLERTLGLEPDCVATGHYVRKGYDPALGRHFLAKGRDRHKDQTYVLYVLSQDILARALFPLGDLTKDSVREIAARKGLATAHKAESQEICFIPDNDYGRFLRQYLPGCAEPGPMFDRSGRIVGTHRGVIHYTVGQRKGLGLAGGPHYVVAIDAARNALIVGDDQDTLATVLVAEHVNLVSLGAVPGPLRVGARIRYRAADAPATIAPLSGGRLRVQFDQPQRAITPGQAVVFYEGERLVGGGTIADSFAEQAGGEGTAFGAAGKEAPR